MKDLFKVGDNIINKNPYKGEASKLIVDIKDNYYMCVNMADHPDFIQKEGLHVEYTDSYRKIN